MKRGETVRYWQWDREGEGDVHTGTFLGIEGRMARVKEGNRTSLIYVNWIFR